MKALRFTDQRAQQGLDLLVQAENLPDSEEQLPEIYQKGVRILQERLSDRSIDPVERTKIDNVLGSYIRCFIRRLPKCWRRWNRLEQARVYFLLGDSVEWVEKALEQLEANSSLTAKQCKTIRRIASEGHRMSLEADELLEDMRQVLEDKKETAEGDASELAEDS